jgi:enoyl-CoA hydratase/long-chain 3-hydroxyacyl-CoA dehydrogenase
MISMQGRQLLRKWSMLPKHNYAATALGLDKSFSTTSAKSSTADIDPDLVKVDLKGDVAVITINDVNSKVNAMSLKMIEATMKAIEHVESNSAVNSAVLISGKPGMFIAGADISMINAMDSVDAAAKGSAEAQQFFQEKIEGSKKPIVAAINGSCLGMGLEIAMSCHYRVALDSPKVGLGLPEVMLGVLPGAGGTQRLPKLVGLPTSLDMMLTGKQLKAVKAKKAGLVDKVIEELGPGDVNAAGVNSLKHLENQAVQAASDLAAKKIKPKRGKKWTNMAGLSYNVPLKVKPVRNFVFKKATETVMKKTMGLYPAPLEIIKATQAGLNGGVQAGYKQEALGFGTLTQTKECNSLIGLFNGQNECKKNDYGLPEKRAQNIAVLGAGLMGAGIAEVSIHKAGHNVILKDATAAGLGRGYDQVFDNMNKRTKKRQMTSFERDVILSKMEPSLNYDGFKNTDMVIEAVFEDINIKHKVLAEVEAVIPDHCIFASNTSALPIKDIAAKSKRPENVIGMHYFSPVDKMPLLEIITTDQTSHEATASAVDVGLKQGKTVIVVKDGPGFYTTRILMPTLQEAISLLQEGKKPTELDKASKQFGFPVGCVTLVDEVGIDVGAHIADYLGEVFKDRFQGGDWQLLHDMVNEGNLGRKSKKGFFDYSQKKGKRPENASASAIIAKYQKAPPVGLSPDETAMRLISRMANEALLCLEEGILKNPVDGDIGAVFGLGFPPPHGGPFRFVDRYGAGNLVKLMEKFQGAIGEAQFTPCQLLLDHAKDPTLKFHSK